MQKVTVIALAVMMFAVATAVAHPQRMFTPRDFERMHIHRMRYTHELQSTADVVAFLKGAAFGLETELGDPAACARDISNMTTDINVAWSHIREGIQHKKLKDIAVGIFALADGFEKAASAFKDCGVEKAAQDIMRIVTEIRSGNIQAFIKNELVHIWGHGRELIHLFKAGAEAYKARDFYNLGVNAGEIVAILIDTKDAIEAQPADMVKFVQGIAEGLGSQMGDPSKCARDIDVMAHDFAAAWNDIITGIRKISLSTIKRAIQEFADGLHTVADSFGACGLEKAEAAIKDIIAQIKGGKLLEVIAKEAVHIFCHHKDLIALFKDASSTWKSGDFINSGRDTGKILGFLLEIPPAQA